MRRVLIGLAVTTLTVLALTAPASAASGTVSQVFVHVRLAAAVWSTSSATSFTNTVANVSESAQGTLLGTDQFTGNLDANGNFTGGTETFANVTSGFSFAIDHALLTSASVSGSGLPATTCTFDANFEVIGCTASTIDVNVDWTGQGPVTHSVSNDHFASDGFSVTSHFNGTDRTATAAGTVGGLTVSASELQSADLGTETSGAISVCIGSSC